METIKRGDYAHRISITINETAVTLQILYKLKLKILNAYEFFFFQSQPQLVVGLSGIKKYRVC